MRTQLSELENERSNHQKLIKENCKLEQRFEKVKIELLKYSKSHANQAQSQYQTNTTELEMLIEELEQDSKVQLDSTNLRNTTDLNSELANFESNKLLYMTANGAEMDISLISKLNRRIAALELERRDLKSKSDSENKQEKEHITFEQYLSNEQLERLQQEKDFEIIKSQELELENQKLREDITRLRDLISDNQIGKTDSMINKEMMNQFDALNEEVQRRRDECIHLKSLLIAKYRLQSQSETGGDHTLNGDKIELDSINTDGNEFEVGYNTQKILNRVLENQINEIKRNHELEKQQTQKEIKLLREENERQHSILMQNLPPERLAEATFKNEIMKLADQNLVSLFKPIQLDIFMIF
jgi:myosin-5